MQTDPIRYGDGLNMYGYVGNDPMNRIDPLGLRGYCVLPSGPQDSKKECEDADGEWVIENSGHILALGTGFYGASGIGSSFGGLSGGGGCGGPCNAVAEVTGNIITVTADRLRKTGWERRLNNLPVFITHTPSPCLVAIGSGAWRALTNPEALIAAGLTAAAGGAIHANTIRNAALPLGRAINLVKGSGVGLLVAVVVQGSAGAIYASAVDERCGA